MSITKKACLEIRQNSRHRCYVCVEDTEKIFLKQSVLEQEKILDEIAFFECFKKVNAEIVPQFMRYKEGYLMAPWLEGYSPKYFFEMDKNNIDKLCEFFRNNFNKSRDGMIRNKSLERVSFRRKSKIIEDSLKMMRFYNREHEMFSNQYFIQEFYKILIDILNNNILVHGDLGHSNIMIDDSDNMKIIDFEFSMFSAIEFDISRVLVSMSLEIVKSRKTEWNNMFYFFNSVKGLCRLRPLQSFIAYQILMQLFYRNEHDKELLDLSNKFFYGDGKSELSAPYIKYEFEKQYS